MLQHTNPPLNSFWHKKTDKLLDHSTKINDVAPDQVIQPRCLVSVHLTIASSKAPGQVLQPWAAWSLSATFYKQGKKLAVKM